MEAEDVKEGLRIKTKNRDGSYSEGVVKEVRRASSIIKYDNNITLSVRNDLLIPLNTN